MGKLGGGLLIYIANHIIYKRRHDLEQSDVENIWIEIKFPHNKPLLINFAYRPPNSNQDWIDKYENLSLTAEFNDTNFLLFGDYNINFNLSSTCLYSNTKWAKLIKGFELHQHITVPTRVTRNSSSIIDHVYSTCPNFVQEISVPEIGISDHFPVAITYKYSKGNIGNRIQSITYRSFNNLDLDKFLMDLAKTNFDLVETINDPCKALDHFYLMLNNCLSKHIPVKVKQVKKLRQPDWFNEEIKQAIRTRNNFKQGHNFYMYKIWRNKVTAIFNKSKKDYFNKAIQSKTDSKTIWKNLQRISSNEKNPYELPDNLIVDDSDEEGTVNVINALNRHFVNISEIVTKAPFDPKNFEDFKIYLDNTIKNSYFDIQFITALEVRHMIEKLDNNKATGLDGISPKILKLCKDFISKPISVIINSCISTGIFPVNLKKASVKPLFKGGDKSDPNNYRPISVLPTISKIFERHIANQLKIFLKTTDVLFAHQSGFRENHSCQTSLIRLIDTWLMDMDDGKIIGSVFLDF